MKKTVLLIICAAMLLTLAACGSGGEKPDDASAAPEEKPGDTMALSEVLSDILDGVEDLPAAEVIPIDDGSFENYLFIPPVEGSEAYASEGLISAIAHSVAVLRVPADADAEAIAADIEANANPGKWICVIAEKTVVKVHGSTILLVMSFTDTADAIAANFDALWA